MKIKSIFIGIVIYIFLSSVSSAKINSKKDADEFIQNYCIEIVATIEHSYSEQKLLAKQNKWAEFEKKSIFILGLADLYSKLCK
tara:strand:- start:371 stop:622 length:252 start_codon:yes stop_codon:yes gene_type:complete